MKYKGATIENTPTEKFPEMVTIIKTTKKIKELMGKRFVNEVKAINTVDAILAETFIEKTKINTFKDLMKVNGVDVDIE